MNKYIISIIYYMKLYDIYNFISCFLRFLFFLSFLFCPFCLKFPIFGLPYPLFDLTPLKETVSRFVDFDRLKRRNEGLIHDSSYTPRLIMTSTDIQRGEAVLFDKIERILNAIRSLHV